MDMMKKLSMLSLTLLAAGILSAEIIQLPEPQRDGGMPLQEALNKRQTVRKYQQTALTQKQISSLLWSAAGVNRDNGRLTVPSAMNRQEVGIFLLTADGGFYYNPHRDFSVDG